MPVELPDDAAMPADRLDDLGRWQLAKAGLVFRLEGACLGAEPGGVAAVVVETRVVHQVLEADLLDELDPAGAPLFADRAAEGEGDRAVAGLPAAFRRVVGAAQAGTAPGVGVGLRRQGDRLRAEETTTELQSQM